MSGRDFKPEPVKVTLGGKDRELFYDLNAMVELEDRYGSLSELLQVKGTMKNTRFMLWAGLLWKEPNLTEKEVGSWLTMAEVPQLMEDVTKALLSCFPKPDPKNG